jgi:hypothetical protein
VTIARRIYIAGPITKGDYISNIRQAVNAAHALRERGWYPFVPHLCALWELVSPRPYEDWLEQDFAWLDVCDALLRLPGESPGADREVARARQAGKLLYFNLEDVIR